MKAVASPVALVGGNRKRVSRADKAAAAATTERKTARLFTNGASQAVRLPKEFRMSGTEVRIWKEGNRVVMEPIETGWQRAWTETDRIAAMAAELGKLGATVEAGADFLRVVPPVALRPATIDTYDDHRMAMSFSLAACGGVAVRINDPGCVSKTYPAYFAQLAALSQVSP